jgi:hypothetical protein
MASSSLVINYAPHRPKKSYMMTKGWCQGEAFEAALSNYETRVFCVSTFFIMSLSMHMVLTHLNLQYRDHAKLPCHCTSLSWLLEDHEFHGRSGYACSFFGTWRRSVMIAGN